MNHAKWIGSFLKIWCDRYPLMAEIKGGSIKICPKRIFCTSNFTLNQLFDGQMALVDHFDCYVKEGDNISHYKRKKTQVQTGFIASLIANEEGFSDSLKPQVDETDEASPSKRQHVPKIPSFYESEAAEEMIWSQVDFETPSQNWSFYLSPEARKLSKIKFL